MGRPQIGADHGRVVHHLARQAAGDAPPPKASEPVVPALAPAPPTEAPPAQVAPAAPAGEAHTAEPAHAAPAAGEHGGTHHGPNTAVLVMQLGAQAVFVGSGIFKSSDPTMMARAIVEATANFRDPEILVKVSRGLGDAMPGLEIGQLETKLADRGW